MAIKGYRLQQMKEHFRENTLYYFFALVFVCVGLALGLYISLTGYKYTALLSAPDKNMFSYITGTAPYTSIFYSRLVNVILTVAIIFVLTITKYTLPLSYLFLSYQMALVVLTSAAIITMYGLSGVLNVILFVVPINLVNIALMVYGVGVGHERAKLWQNYKLKFGDSFKETSFAFKFFIFAAGLFCVAIINSFILPIFIKSFVVVNF